MRTRILLVLLLALCLPGLTAAPGARAADARAAEGTPSAGSDRGGDPYWPLDGNGGTDARHYDVRVAYDFGTGRLTGRTAATMVATADLKSFSLDLLLPVTSVKVDGRPARFRKPSKHELRVVPKRPIAKGARFKVVVKYAGRPASYGYAGERNWLADRHEVVAMNQPHMAPWWFPSNDHPSDKATFDIRVTAPRGKQVVSNGLRVSRKVAGARATTRWRMTDPMATYLAFFAAGDFVVEKGRSAAGIPFYNAVSKQLPAGQRAQSVRMLRRTAGMTDWLQRRLGTYPFASTGGLVTGLDVGFALENQTRPTYGSWIYPSVMVHELAHQWFGDSVAVRRWRDIWLNEGFASYLEVDYAAAHGGPSVESWLADRWRTTCATDSFWRLDIADPGAARVFDDAVYDRGAMVIAALRNRIGAADLTTLLRTWVRDHRGGNATVEQFVALAESVSGESLDAFFRAWLSSGRAPAGTADNGLGGACR
ncbi:M1 family peptidase [Pimelobacter simplex]|uniref:Aminopeptidase N n=1 Tax=Nocardioides simplex TaxID=2045 RepID=A0A0C5XHE0_NOCSI|nr:M1 family metallopeptidase [Pimelobacter simplex]AJR18561.1 putative metallopeptidase [Pimelobacter simplex]MCG8153552.1 M1 family peptidase [Pimelobacter simplex]GEB15783.1 peptidase [Pimelobacter simplex]SFN10770.1 Peptidase family M1 [Pimelobacter simplex]